MLIDAAIWSGRRVIRARRTAATALSPRCVIRTTVKIAKRWWTRSRPPGAIPETPGVGVLLAAPWSFLREVNSLASPVVRSDLATFSHSLKFYAAFFVAAGSANEAASRLFLPTDQRILRLKDSL